MLKPMIVQQDQFIFVENDPIEGIYYLTKGAAGFVLKEKQTQHNIIYIEIIEGDDFGQVDIISCAVDNNCSLQKIFDFTDMFKR